MCVYVCVCSYDYVMHVYRMTLCYNVVTFWEHDDNRCKDFVEKSTHLSLHIHINYF